MSSGWQVVVTVAKIAMAYDWWQIVVAIIISFIKYLYVYFKSDKILKV